MAALRLAMARGLATLVLMGEVSLPEKVKLIAGLLAGDESLLAPTRAALERLLGAIEQVTVTWPFDTTDYYAEEMGPSIVRQFVSFREPFDMERLAEVKLATNDLELHLARSLPGCNGGRPVNIDPGYITLGSLVLATTKNRAHRIYLGKGIFAEVTLGFEGGKWCAWPWTYPDYASGWYDAFLTEVRTCLKKQRQGGQPRTS